MPPIRDRAAEFARATESALEQMPEGHDRARFQKFAREVAPFADQAKAQLFQDLWAWWESGLKRGGYFVEFGAASGGEPVEHLPAGKISGLVRGPRGA